MMYLMVASPSLLPVDQSSVAMLDWCRGDGDGRSWVSRVESRADTLQPGKETLEKIKDGWRRPISFAANKARPETLAAQLARGGELLSFVWLQLGFCSIKGNLTDEDNLTHLIFGS